jgi:hypothetical protein
MSEYDIHTITCIRCKNTREGIGNDVWAYCIQCMQERNTYRNSVLIKSPYPKFNAEMRDSFAKTTMEISHDMDESELRKIFDTFVNQPEFDAILIKKINQEKYGGSKN